MLERTLDYDMQVELLKQRWNDVNDEYKQSLSFTEKLGDLLVKAGTRLQRRNTNAAR